MSTPDHFDPATATLTLSLPLPPTDNKLHSSTRFGYHASKEYQAWLRIAHPPLQALLGDWRPDTSRWWSVAAEIRLGDRGDAANLIKATLDLLTGRDAATEARTGWVEKRSGNARTLKEQKISRGMIYVTRGLWDDDRRVAEVRWTLVSRRDSDPGLTLAVRPCEAPVDRKAEGRSAAVARKAEAKAAQERTRTEAAAAKEAAERLRTSMLAGWEWPKDGPGIWSWGEWVASAVVTKLGPGNPARRVGLEVWPDTEEVASYTEQHTAASLDAARRWAMQRTQELVTARLAAPEREGGGR